MTEGKKRELWVGSQPDPPAFTQPKPSLPLFPSPLLLLCRYYFTSTVQSLFVFKFQVTIFLFLSHLRILFVFPRGARDFTNN